MEETTLFQEHSYTLFQGAAQASKTHEVYKYTMSQHEYTKTEAKLR
jgi:hypothetical protein